MKWIPITDRYPELNFIESEGSLSRSVIVTDGLTTTDARYDYSNNEWVFEDPTRDLDAITHWIVLELPKRS